MIVCCLSNILKQFVSFKFFENASLILHEGVVIE
jgi:hypothetical protein